jgi:hypothetical protein
MALSIMRTLRRGDRFVYNAGNVGIGLSVGKTRLGMICPRHISSGMTNGAHGGETGDLLGQLS